MVTKIGRMVTYGGRTPRSKMHDLSLRGHVTNEKNVYMHFHNAYSRQTW